MELHLTIDGMSCGGCVASVERALKAVPGVESAAVDLASATARVVFDPVLGSAERIRQAVEDAGYDIKD